MDELEAQDREVGGGFVLIQNRMHGAKLIDEDGEEIMSFQDKPDFSNEALRCIGQAHVNGCRSGFNRGKEAQLDELHRLLNWILKGRKDS